MPSAQGTKSGRQHEYYSMCVCVSVRVARRQWETQTHAQLTSTFPKKEKACTFSCTNFYAHERRAAAHATRDILTDTDSVPLQLPKQPSRKPCPQIRSVYLCMCALSVLSISYHWGGDASQGIILSDIRVCSLALSRKQGQAGSPGMEALGFDAVSITTSCL